jgi:hypothetical protein
MGLKLAIVLLLMLFPVAIEARASDLAYLEAYKAYHLKDYPRAVRLFEPLAVKGDAMAANLLGMLYMDGAGVRADPSKAIRLWRPHAERGHAPSQYLLGLSYVGGKGVPQDFVLAHMWFNLAGSGEDEILQKGGKERREQIALSMTTAQVAEAQRLAREWRPK